MPLENVNSSRVVYAKDEHPPHRHIQAMAQEMECNRLRTERAQRESEQHEGDMLADVLARRYFNKSLNGFDMHMKVD